MFKHIFLNRIRYYVRTKEFLFWLLVFPIILSTLFHFAFSNLLEDEQMNPIHIGIVDIEKSQESMIYKQVFNSDSFESEYTTMEKAKELLKDEKISAYIYFEDGAHLVISKNGHEQTILKEVLDYVAQQSELIKGIYEKNQGQVTPEFTQAMAGMNSYIKNLAVSENEPNLVVAFFYTVLAMAAMYGATLGVYEIVSIQANQSPVAIRVNLAPVSKMKIFLSNITAGCLAEFLVILTIVAYIRFVLNVDFGTRYPYIILTSLVGAVTGVSFGTCLGVLIKKNENMKVGVVIGFTMTCSFLAGMMSTDMKYKVKQFSPLLDRINPVNLITESYYKLYYYDGLASYWQNIIILLAMIVIFFGITIFALRRQTYDSI